MLRSRTLALLTITGLAAFTAGCGGDDGDSGGGGATQSTQTQTQSTQTQTQSTPSETTQSQSGGSGASASADGKAIFTENCSGCHTLADANASGKVGPNLDDLKPDAATVRRQVTNGGGQMPAFKGRLSTAQISAVADYVSTSAGGG